MKEKLFPDNHKRHKKKLVAPMNHLLQDNGWSVNFIEASHEKAVVPEILWMGYLQDKIGVNKSHALIGKMIELVDELFDKQPYFNGFVSSIKRLTEQQSATYLTELEKLGITDVITDCLFDLKVLFPNFPLGFLIKNSSYYEIGALGYLKNIMNKLNDRTSQFTTFVLCNCYYPLIKTGRISFGKNYEFLHPRELFENPDSERSIKIAADLRMSTKLIDKEIISYDHFGWQKYFWSQCLQLEPCKISTLLHE